MNLYTSVNNVLKRLDDYPTISGEQVWTRAEVELYLRDGYNAFCRQTKCLFDMFYPENVPQAGNYVAKWERTYFDSGMIAVGLIGFSGGYWERDYAQASATGPANLTQPWEATYLETIFAVALHPVPEDNVTVDRATHNFHRLNPEYTRFFEERARDFQTTKGEPWRFAMDRDGIGGFRTVPAGSGHATTYDGNAPFGLLRRPVFVPAGAYWPLDEASGTRYDARNGHNLTAMNAPVGAAGVYRNGCVFDAPTLQYLTVADTPDLQGGDLDFSIACWVYMDNATNDQYYLVGKSDGVAGGESYKLIVSGFGSYTNYIRLWWSSDGTNFDATWGPELPLDEWHFIVAWRDRAAQTINIQMDLGEVYSAASLTGYNSSTAFTVGGSAAPAKYFDGTIDEVYVYRGLWTDSEKQAMYDAHTTDPFGTWAPVGTWGVLREIPEHFPMGAQYGIPRRLYSDTANTRVEYWRLEKDVEENGFEIPERFTRYAEFFAQAKCLERDGPGQDLKLAQHFMERFHSGVRRMVLRLGENKRSVSGKIGSAGRVPTTPSLARLPWKYGRQIRRGY